MDIIHTERAPAAIGPYSQAVRHNGFVFTSGQLPCDPQTGAIAGDTIQEQAEQVMKNLTALLEASGADIAQVVKTTCYLASMEDFSAFNEVYSKHFVGKPARSCVAVKTLPKNALVEVEVVAALEE